VNRRVEKKRIKSGLPVGPAEDGGLPILSIEQLANQHLSEAELTRRLAWAIRQTADDLQHSPGKRYKYEEWAEFTRLIRFTKVGLDQLEYDEDVDGVVEWDWLEDNSPLLSSQSESEWILDRLCESLLRLLKKNMLGTHSVSTSAFPPSSGTDFSGFTFAPRGTTFNESADPRLSKSGKGKEAEPPPPTKLQERQRRASGADAMLTFFTGERRGAHAYVSQAPQWSKKAQSRMKENRRGSIGHKRRGPFSKLEHRERTGAIGGGRGGAGIRTLKMRHFSGDGED